VAEAAIQLRILRRGRRADELLALLARQLELGDLEPDGSGAVVLRLTGRGPQAWDRVREALDGLGADWRQWLYLAPRPRR
jgi:predicted Rdx family selenoprotein